MVVARCTSASSGLVGDVMNKLGPVTDQIKTTVHSLDSVLKNINSIFDPSTKNNLQSVIANMNRTTASLAVSSASIQGMLNEQSGATNQSMKNVNRFTRNLADNKEKVNLSLNNVKKATENREKVLHKQMVEKLK